MPDCQTMETLLSQFGEEMSEADQLAVLRHVEACEVCQEQMRRAASLARMLTELPAALEVVTDHLSDLDLAELAARGYGASNAEAFVAHLAQCRACRREFAAIRMTLERYAEFLPAEQDQPEGRRRSLWDGLVADLSRAVSTPRRALHAVVSLLVFGAECFAFALAVAWTVVTVQGWARQPVETPSWHGIPSTALVAGFLVLGGLLRQVAAWAFGVAKRPEAD